MDKKVKKKGSNPLAPFVNWWKKMDSEKRVLLIIVVIVFAFIMFMPKIYKGWVSFRDNGFHFGSSSNNNSTNTNKPTTTDPNAGKTLTMTCSQTVEDADYKTTVQTIISYVDSQLKSENYTLKMEAISDIGKSELSIRKALYDVTEATYQQYKGFTVKSDLTDDIFTFNLVTNYAQIDRDAIEANLENEGSISVDLEYNQNIDSVKSYYESIGLTCKK